MIEGKQMAQQVNVSFVDDLDGSEADGTVSFGLNGKTFEIDLSAQNEAVLRDALAPYVAAGRRVGGGVRVARRGAAPAGDRERNQAIREWAEAQGLAVAARGRISVEIVDAYEKRGAALAAVAAEPEVVEEKAAGRAKAPIPVAVFSGAE